MTTVEQVNTALTHAYIECDTYRDSGIVTNTITPDGRRTPHTTMQRFCTAFIRPDRFRFEFREVELVESEGCRYLVHAEPSAVRSWWQLEPALVRSHPSILDSLAGPTGISHGVASTVPFLLLARQFRKQLGLICDPDAFVLVNDCVDGVDYLRLDRQAPVSVRAAPATLGESDEPVMLRESFWIHPKTFLLHRSERQNRFSDFTSATTTIYKPAVNETISDSKLAFDPELESD